MAKLLLLLLPAFGAAGGAWCVWRRACSVRRDLRLWFLKSRCSCFFRWRPLWTEAVGTTAHTTMHTSRLKRDSRHCCLSYLLLCHHLVINTDGPSGARSRKDFFEDLVESPLLGEVVAVFVTAITYEELAGNRRDRGRHVGRLLCALPAAC